jgi:uncharacterized glyoxalase superfamily protein PhnB
MHWLAPNLMVEDVSATVEWYERTLDAERIGEMPEDGDDLVWAQIEMGDVWIMFQQRESLEEELPSIAGTEIGGSFTMYIDVDDIDSLATSLEDVSHVLEMRTTDYGRREFAIEDPNGYVLWFGEKAEG